LDHIKHNQIKKVKKTINNTKNQIKTQKAGNNHKNNFEERNKEFPG